MKSLLVACPRCQKKFNYYESEFRPFCCEKCRLIDLGQWLNESYTVPVSKLTLEEAQELEQLINEKNQNSDEDDKLH
jgi:endogenous inhibitor of DNA gyrase (YacG/DUF329 family)